MTATPRFTVPRTSERGVGVRRPGTVYLHITRRVDRRGIPVDGVEDGYIGQARDVTRRTAQHAGEIPQRSGEIAESPWFDLKTGATVTLAEGSFTNDELDEREEAWIAKLQPRFNDRHNPRRDKIRKFEARRHRDNRDIARGLTPRQWEPLQVAPAKRRRLSAKWRHRRNVVLAYAGSWSALTVTLWLACIIMGMHLPGRTFPIAAAGGIALVPLLRRCKKRDRQFGVAAVTVACALLWLLTG